MAFHGKGDFVTIAVFHPRYVSNASRHGVVITLGRMNAEEPIFQDSLEYHTFLYFMDQSGLCELTTIRERLGRWVTDMGAQYMKDQAAIHEAGSYRHPPNFGAW